MRNKPIGNLPAKGTYGEMAHAINSANPMFPRKRDAL